MIDNKAYRGASLQVQLFQERWRDGQHDRAADLA
jgi:hypothetical protein